MSVTDNALDIHNVAVNNQCCPSFQGTAVHRQKEREWYITQIKCYIKEKPHAESDEIWQIGNGLNLVVVIFGDYQRLQNL